MEMECWRKTETDVHFSFALSMACDNQVPSIFNCSSIGPKFIFIAKTDRRKLLESFIRQYEYNR